MSGHRMFYLARHAEGEANISDRRIGSNTPLTECGKWQAAKLAARCKGLQVGSILCSPIQRALETATYVSESCDLDIVRMDRLRERKRPSILNGLVKTSDEAHQVNRTMRENFHLPHWRFSDEENFDDLKARAFGVLKYMETCNAERIVAITHGIIIRIIVACAFFGEEITGEDCERFIRGLRMQRAGITALSLNHNMRDEGIAARFQLWMWNDHAHLEGARA